MPTSPRRCASSKTPPARSAASSRRSIRRRGCGPASSPSPGSRRTRPARPVSRRSTPRGTARAGSGAGAADRAPCLAGWRRPPRSCSRPALGLWALQLRTTLDAMNARVERAEAEVVRIQRTVGEAQQQTRVLQANNAVLFAPDTLRVDLAGEGPAPGLHGARLHEPAQRRGLRRQSAAGAAGRQGLPAVGRAAGRRCRSRSAPACWRRIRAATPRCSSRCRPTCRLAAASP